MSLEDRIQRLEDIEEIRLLRFHYHQYINEQQTDRIADLFTEDAAAKMDSLVSWQGREAIRAFFAEPQPVSLVKQFPHNHIVEVEGDTAKGISYFEARYAANGESLMIAGSYDEEYRRADGRWLISKSNMKIHFAVPLGVGWGATGSTTWFRPSLHRMANSAAGLHPAHAAGVKADEDRKANATRHCDRPYDGTSG